MIQQQAKSNMGLKLMMTVLYALQGMFYGYVYSIPLSYTQIPSYYILGLFGAASLPFSFKFVLAPIVQRYYCSSYGKRKTWMVSALILCSIFIFVMASYSKKQCEQSQKYTAFFLFFCVLCIALKDIAADSFVVDVLDSRSISLITFIGDEIGKLIAMPLFLTVISSKFMLKKVSFLREMFIKSTAIFGVALVLLVHFKMDETKYQPTQQRLSLRSSQQFTEEQQTKGSFKKIMKHYSIFINPEYRLCRLAIFLFLINFGMEVFVQTFPVELIKAGFNKQNLMLGQNISFIPAAVVSYIIGNYMSNANCFKYYYICTIIKFVYMVLIHMLKIKRQSTAISLYVVLFFISSVHYYLENVCMNQKSKGKFSGLSITLLLSISNFGRLTVFQKMIMSEVGYNRCIIGCFVYTALLLYLIYRLRKWLEEGISLHTKEKQDILENLGIVEKQSIQQNQDKEVILEKQSNQQNDKKQEKVQ